MTLDPMVWEQIRAGRAPDAEIVAEIARSERAVLGSAGASAAGARLSAAVLGAGPLDRLEFAESLAGDRNNRQLFGMIAGTLRRAPDTRSAKLAAAAFLVVMRAIHLSPRMGPALHNAPAFATGIFNCGGNLLFKWGIVTL